MQATDTSTVTSVPCVTSSASENDVEKLASSPPPGMRIGLSSAMRIPAASTASSQRSWIGSPATPSAHTTTTAEPAAITTASECPHRTRHVPSQSPGPPTA